MSRLLLSVSLIAAWLFGIAGQSVDTVAAAPSESVGVLVPPADLWPFAVMQRHVTSITATDYRLDFFRPPQTNVNNPNTMTGHVILTGTQGRTAYDQRLLHTAMNGACDPKAAYCASTPYPGGKLTNESFKGLQVVDSPALVAHILCCNGHHWSVLWYNAALDTTYELLLSYDVADELSPSTLDQANVATAEAVAGIAAGLAPLR